MRFNESIQLTIGREIKQYINIILLLLCAIVWFFSTYIFLGSITLSEYSLSVLFCFVYLICLLVFVNRDKSEVTLEFLFLITFGLFIGGRYFAFIVGYEISPFITTFFLNYSLSDIDKLELTYKCLSFVFFYTLGVCSVPKKVKKKIPIPTHFALFVSRVSIFLFPLFAFYYLLSLIDLLQNAISYGYQSLYGSQGAEIDLGGAAASLIYTLVLFFLGYSISSGNKKATVLYLTLFIVIATTYLIIGARAKFGASILLFVWFYFRKRKFNMSKFILFGIIGYFVLSYLASLSIRAEGNDNDSDLLELFFSFIYSQGVTLMVVDLADKVADYPLMAYIQLFVPASSSFTALFMPVERFETSFGNFLAYNLDKNLYLSGNGLGWSVVSDLYLLSGMFIPIYLLLCAFLGSCISLLSSQSKNNVYLYALYIMLFTRLIYVPRGSLNSVLPMVSWFVIFSTLLFVAFSIYNLICRVGVEK